MAMESPSTNFELSSSIKRASIVRYGSHSEAFATTYSAVFPAGILYFTFVGNPAPPIPTIPASFSRVKDSSTEHWKGSKTERYSVRSESSPWIMMQGTSALPATIRLSIFLTVPAMEAWTGTAIGLLPAAIF